MLSRTMSREACRGDLFLGVERPSTTSPRARPSLERLGFSSTSPRNTETLRFGERSRATERSVLGGSTSSLLSPFGSRGRGKTTRSGAAMEAWRDVGHERACGPVPGNLVRRTCPFPRVSDRASSSSSDDDEKSAGRFDEGRGRPTLVLRSSMGHDAAGAAAAFPPTVCSDVAMCFPVMDAETESSVRVGLVVEGEKVSVSPVQETVSAIVTALTADNLWCVKCWSGVRANSTQQ